MRCNICGAEMIQRGISKKSGYPLWRCPNTPHEKCPKCNHVLLTKYHPAVCSYCGYERKE